MRRRPHDRWGRDERGAAAVFVVGMSVMLFVCAGLVVDGGLAINARMAVADDAEQASRIGADSIDVDTLRAEQRLVIDQRMAEQRAAQFLSDRGYGPGQYAVSVTGDSVVVTVRDSVEPMILQIVQIPPFDVEATAASTPETGF